MSGCLVLQENKEGLELLKTAIAKAGYTGKVGSWIFFIFLIKLSSLTSSPPLVAILLLTICWLFFFLFFPNRL